MKALLKEIGHIPNRRLSQNFLIDDQVVHQILTLAHVSKEDLVVEIGAGTGALTLPLLSLVRRVIAIEKDPKLVPLLYRCQTTDQRLEVMEADALHVSFEAFSRPFKIIGNLPYHITAPLLEICLTMPSPPTSCTLMVQYEVGQRLTATPSTPDYSSLTLFREFYADVIDSFKVPPKAFYPEPKVASQVLHLRPRLKLPFDDPPFLFQLIRKSFQQRRKMLRSSLRPMYTSLFIEEGLLAVNASITARPENLSLDTWISLANWIRTST
jgi:16S rRNA (adenine1518-N6/adenine1519-N6)-dimethyltransferase